MCTIQDIQGKLGTPKPDQCRSGVRGVFFDKQVGQLKIFLDMHQSCVNATGQKVNKNDLFSFVHICLAMLQDLFWDCPNLFKYIVQRFWDSFDIQW